jgi:hypothetical protein
MNVEELIAIEVHVHAEVSCCQPVDPIWQTYIVLRQGPA